MTDAPPPRRFGRTWADLIVSGGGMFVLLIVTALLLIFAPWDSLPSIPIWVLVALAMSLIWTPWLIARAKDDATLLLISTGPTEISEWRVGRKFPLDIDGAALPMTSSTSGARRLLLTAFDPDTGRASGTALEGFTTFDIARDLTAFRRLSEAFQTNLTEDRIHREMVGVEVERRVSELSAQWLRMLWGSLSMDELESVLAPAVEAAPDPEPEEALEVADDE